MTSGRPPIIGPEPDMNMSGQHPQGTRINAWTKRTYRNVSKYKNRCSFRCSLFSDAEHYRKRSVSTLILKVSFGPVHHSFVLYPALSQSFRTKPSCVPNSPLKPSPYSVIPRSVASLWLHRPRTRSFRIAQATLGDKKYAINADYRRIFPLIRRGHDHWILS